MSNSSLISYTKLTKNCDKPRNHAIDKITIHHMAGFMTAKECADYFYNTSAEVSANYCIGNDGAIALSVEEKNRAWTSSSSSNDNRAVTIEVANCKGSPNWEVSDKALASLINLCVDICKRNGIKKLNFTGDASGNLTMHKYFASTSCPGPYLGGKFPYITSEVNKRLTATTTTKTTTTATKTSTTTTSLKVGDLVTIKNGATYYSGGIVPSWVASQKWYISSISGARAVLGYNEKRTNNITSPINTKYLTRSATKKSNEEIAREVLNGKWGNGEERKSKLKSAGYDYATIQALVNKLV